jgi:DNA invertase Pin-like site-specific DNA recombinase
MGRKIGYGRTSTIHQQQGLDAQVQELKDEGCEEVFSERISTTTPLEKRHQLRTCLSVLQKGDILVVSKLDRLGRYQVEVINRLNELQQQGIQVKTLDCPTSWKGRVLQVHPRADWSCPCNHHPHHQGETDSYMKETIGILAIGIRV